MGGPWRERLWRQKPMPLDRFARIELDSTAKADHTLVSIPGHERGSGFHPIPGIGSAIRYRFGNRFDPVGKFSIYTSSAESVGRFWFRESSQVVIKGDFHSVVGTKAVGSSGNHSDFVIEALDGAVGDLFFGAKPVKDERLMCTQHPGYLFHRFQTAAHGPEAPVVEKAASPEHGLVLPEIGEGFLQIPGSCGGQLAGQQGIELLPSPPAYPIATAE